ncbi:MAG: citramalate synthase [Rhodospirillaceae bacterium]|jgi:hydroxymethylglutaryl-CoA lyase|nr:citramalate synthase [Rhodospirillaceae bacterium]MBT4044699.1 citramalate synthase [Rhodospirillaceae bacterium]MBT4690361.1 citramalate synthase [Rhodospirillaceae bacterium]MBT5084016.1 citramalate synthase [Rhodospirillaceae bacterium]MBT5523926.1 citramalate synthase [Rhodospirillaceae bacterium]
MSLLPKSVIITDDTMREGLQIESAEIPVDEKLRLLDALGETGAKVISIGSFAHPKWTPSMACIDEIAERFVPKPGVKYTAAVFNKRGFDRADAYYPKIDVRGKLHRISVELCDTFARRNYNRTQAEQIAGVDAAVATAREAGAEFGAVGLGNPFGSNYEGPFSMAQRMEMLDLLIGKWHNAGIKVSKVSFLDAMGWNMPHEVRETLLAIKERYPEVTDFHMHLHDSRGVTLTSYYEALQLGVREFDTSIGGMGGCPYCGNGRAAGHVPTEDFVNLCHELGIETGYDLDKLIEAAAIAEEVVGHSLWGHVSKSGARPRGAQLYPANMPFVETLEEAAHFRKGPQVYAGQLSPWKDGDALSR